MKPLQSMWDRKPPPLGKPPREGMSHTLGNTLNIFLRTALLVVFAALSSPSWGEPIGRLFTTPDERAQLDRARLTGLNKEKESTPTQQPQNLTLNGIVKRSSGKATVWINSSAQNETSFPPGSKVRIAKTRLPYFPVWVPKTGKMVALKVGQTLNIDNGEIREGYQSPAVAESGSTQAGKVNSG
jgi:hypothetical protein